MASRTCARKMVRDNVMEKGKVEVRKDLEHDFDLVVKHLTMFTALLPALVERFPCYVTIRNPLRHGLWS